jgi:glycosyltransferase involved in cell wall biosynthesis
MSKTKELAFSIIIPAYNEANTIKETLNEIEKVLKAEEFLYEIILVCDGDGDGTSLRAAESNISKLRILTYIENRGKGFAIRYGASQAYGANLIFIDADLDLHPNRIPELIEIFEGEKLDLLIGSKLHPNSIVNYPNSRKVMSSLYRKLIKNLFGFSISDTQTGLKICRKECFESISKDLQIDGFAFDLELIALFSRKGFVIGEGPITLNYNFSSSVQVKSVIQMLFSTLKIYIRVKQ